MRNTSSLPLDQRPNDKLFIVIFLLFAVTSFFVDRLAALDVDFEKDGWLIAALRYYGNTVDPLFLENPQWLRVMSGVSAFIFGPLYLAMAWAFWRGIPQVRLPALAYAWAMLYSMTLHLWMEFFGDFPPKNIPVLLLVYAPYVALPIALVIRLKDEDVFSPPTDHLVFFEGNAENLS